MQLQSPNGDGIDWLGGYRPVKIHIEKTKTQLYHFNNGYMYKR